MGCEPPISCSNSAIRDELGHFARTAHVWFVPISHIMSGKLRRVHQMNHGRLEWSSPVTPSRFGQSASTPTRLADCARVHATSFRCGCHDTRLSTFVSRWTDVDRRSMRSSWHRYRVLICRTSNTSKPPTAEARVFREWQFEPRDELPDRQEPTARVRLSTALDFADVHSPSSRDLRPCSY
jgi:hypothetical protein